MKLTTILTTAILGIALSLGLTSCGDSHDQAHDEHGDHDEQTAHDDHDEDKDDDHDGHDEGGEHADHDHDHEKLVAGPNGGRLVVEVEPHLEFLVTDDRKVRITAVGEDNKVVPIATQTVSAIAGDRSSPTRLAFAADGAGLLSDVTLPDGNDFPIVLQIKTSPDAETVREKFNVNFSDCPTCDYQEYACICGHGDEGHDHDEEKE